MFRKIGNISRNIAVFLSFYVILAIMGADLHIGIKAMLVASGILLGYILIRPSSRTSRNPLLSKLFAIVFLVSITVFWGSFVFYRNSNEIVYRIRGKGMQPTLDPNDFVLIGKPENLSRGDIVIYEPPVSFYKGSNIPSPLIGRIVGIETEALGIRENKLIVNDREILEPYTNITSDYILWPPKDIPVNHFFILQDKRYATRGSHQFGSVPSSDILCKVAKIYKVSSLSYRDWGSYLSGTLLTLLFICIPIVIYHRMLSNKLLKLLLIYHTSLSIVILLVIIYSIYGILLGKPSEWWFLPLTCYYTILAGIRSTFMSSSFAMIVIVLFAWVGGIVSIIEITRIYSQKIKKPNKEPDKRLS